MLYFQQEENQRLKDIFHLLILNGFNLMRYTINFKYFLNFKKYIFIYLTFTWQDFTEYTNLEQSIDYLNNYITCNGPFHGLLGFSQVALFTLILLLIII